MGCSAQLVGTVHELGINVVVACPLYLEHSTLQTAILYGSQESQGYTGHKNDGSSRSELLGSMPLATDPFPASPH